MRRLVLCGALSSFLFACAPEESVPQAETSGALATKPGDQHRCRLDEHKTDRREITLTSGTPLEVPMDLSSCRPVMLEHAPSPDYPLAMQLSVTISDDAAAALHVVSDDVDGQRVMHWMHDEIWLERPLWIDKGIGEDYRVQPASEGIAWAYCPQSSRQWIADISPHGKTRFSMRANVAQCRPDNFEKEPLCMEFARRYQHFVDVAYPGAAGPPGTVDMRRMLREGSFCATQRRRSPDGSFAGLGMPAL